MDLDFSFALVSSLTPRPQPSRIVLTENNKLSSKSTRIKTTKSVSTQQSSISLRQQRDINKENHPLEEQLMNEDECFQQNDSPKFDFPCNSKESLSYAVDMTNIAIRSNKSSRDRRKPPSSFNSKKRNVRSSNGKISDLNSKEINCRRNSNQGLDLKTTSLSNYNSSVSSLVKKGRKRKSNQENSISKSSDSSIDFVESPSSEVKPVSLEISKDLSIYSSLERSHSKSPLVANDLINTSLSTAYDSGSFRPTRRRGAKVISETPESVNSFENNSSRKKKCSLDSSLSNSDKCRSSGETSQFLTCSSNSLRADSSQKKESPKNCKIAHQGGQEKKTLRSSSNIHLLLPDAVSSLQVNSISDEKEQGNSKGVKENNESKGSRRKLLISSPGEVVNDNKMDAVEGKQFRNKTVEDHNGFRNKKGKNRKGRIGDKHSLNNADIANCNFVPPSEVIPKFEHINNWLKGTRENSIIVLSSDSSFNSPEKVSKPTKKSKKIKSLSPRVKRKIQEAQTTLKEEQQIFEELYGSDFAKRLSDDTEENFSIESTRQSLEISEKVLEKIYGTVWQKDEVLPMSEPRRGRPNYSSSKKGPQTERKKHRTSIFDVFSSSSSEDRFEEFLENVHRGKIRSTHRLKDDSDNGDFINDSDVETSFTYYQSALSSAIKEDVEALKTPKVNRRRLSFASSQEECSESVKSDLKPKGKDKKITPKKNNPKIRSKKETKQDSKIKANSDVNGFPLVTPLKVKDKNTDKQLNDRINNLIESELPKSVGKSKTPKNKLNKDNNINSEERLREKYLNGDNFKVPKHLNSLKTPNKSSKVSVPSSPALSFLSSLSEITAGLPCHPDALIFKKNFKDKREELAKKLFSLYNREVFDNQLPENMMIEWSTRMTSTSGFCYNKRMYSNSQVYRSSRIVLSAKILDRADRLRDTLIHELCHAATWIINATSDGHGPKWKAWADKANRRFPELPVIKRCHDYAISTKFTYKCMTCGYCIGRHSKSLNTDRKRCGFCFGKFEVFVTAKMSSASVTSGSDSVKTQRNPTGFALFVKENYATVKKENNVPHGQVMKLLSQKFAEVKISKQKGKEP